MLGSVWFGLDWLSANLHGGQVSNMLQHVSIESLEVLVEERVVGEGLFMLGCRQQTARQIREMQVGTKCQHMTWRDVSEFGSTGSFSGLAVCTCCRDGDRL